MQRIGQAGAALIDARQQFGVEHVEREQLHADRAARLREAAAKLGQLNLIGQNDGDGREGITRLDGAQAIDRELVLPEAAGAMRVAASWKI